MKQQINFKCKIASCKKYAKGVMITGKVQGGKITSLSKAILYSNATLLNIETSSAVIIHRIYVSGKIVQECVKGQQVAIYIEGVTHDQVIPNVSYLTTASKQLDVNKKGHKHISVESTSDTKTYNIKETNTLTDSSSNYSKQEPVNKILKGDNSYESLSLIHI